MISAYLSDASGNGAFVPEFVLRKLEEDKLVRQCHSCREWHIEDGCFPPDVFALANKLGAH